MEMTRISDDMLHSFYDGVASQVYLAMAINFASMGDG